LYVLYHDELRRLTITPPHVAQRDDHLARLCVEYIESMCSANTPTEGASL
jgi:hypothetical protein